MLLFKREKNTSKILPHSDAGTKARWFLLLEGADSALRKRESLNLKMKKVPAMDPW